MTTLAALRSELEQLEARIRGLRYQRAQITYQLEHQLEQALKESDRLRRHLRVVLREEASA